MASPYGGPLRVRAFGAPIPDKSHRGYGAGAIADPAVRNWKQVVARYALQAKPPRPLLCPLRVFMVFWMPRDRKALPGEILYPYSPDGDNCFKSTADALQGVIYENDRQIVEGGQMQYYEQKDQGEPAGVHIWVWPINSEIFTFASARESINLRIACWTQQ